LILAGRGSRDPEDWQRRVSLAEAIGARVLTDRKSGATFPTDHPLHGGGADLIVNADVILSLDWVDLAGSLKSAGAGVDAKIIQVSLDQNLHNGWSMDYQGLPPADVYLLAEPDAAVPPLLAVVKELRPNPPSLREAPPRPGPPTLAALEDASVIQVPHIATALKTALGDTPVSMLRLPLSWADGLWEFRHPLDYLGTDGGGGIGSGPGMSVGAALAVRDSGTGRLPVAVLGDGDFLMGATALWTAVHYGIPLLVVVSNNNSFFNDELHQDRMARQRNRPVANRWIGQRIADPEPDLAMLARAQGASGFGPVRRPAEVPRALRDAIEMVEAGGVAVIDVRVEPGYAPVSGSATARG
jgi:thiamine pyrophosphate-dependent acetolactate synthase large subunit-like protein